MEDNKTCIYKNLDFDKILKKLSSEATSEEGKLKSMEVIPDILLNDVKENLQKTYDAHMLVGRYGAPEFSGVRDITHSLKLAQAGATLSTKELLKISSTLSAFRSVLNWKSRYNGELRTSLDMYFDGIYDNRYLEEKLKSILISEDEISDVASKELAAIRKKIRIFAERARERLIAITRNKTYEKYLQEPIVTIRNERFVIPVKEEYKANIPGLVHDTSASGSTLFIEPMSIVEANNQINELKSKEKEEIHKILTELSNEVGGFADLICASHDITIDLDIIFAKAKLAYKMKATMPLINGEGKVKLKRVRHPLIPADQVVPVDISLGYDYSILVITGPNTGGKTVALKTIALMVLMTMCAFMIPAEDGSEISIFDNILIDIGDDQSIEQSLSTFSAHMKNIIQILDCANDKSLVLLDELGAGTDPVEGAALAIAILEELRNSKSKVVATTHYAELKMYALQNKSVENASCEFDINSLRPTYKILMGIPGKSNAFLISKRLGLSESVISRAKLQINAQNTDFEKIITSLNESKQELDIKKQEYDQLLAQLSKEKNILAETIKETKQQSQEIIDREQRKSREIAEKAILESEALLSELESLKKSKRTITADMRKNYNKSLQSLKEFIDPVEESSNFSDKQISSENLKIGDILNLKSCNKLGEVTGFSGKDEVILQVGLIKTKVKINDLSYASKKDIKKNKNQSPVFSKYMNTGDNHVVTEIDVRGLDSNEAIHKVDKFIDTAILHNINKVTIIHGKGKGILRRELQIYLKEHKSVKNYNLGSIGEGDTGVTIVQL